MQWHRISVVSHAFSILSIFTNRCFFPPLVVQYTIQFILDPYKMDGVRDCKLPLESPRSQSSIPVNLIVSGLSQASTVYFCSRTLMVFLSKNRGRVFLSYMLSLEEL